MSIWRRLFSCFRPPPEPSETRVGTQYEAKSQTQNTPRSHSSVSENEPPEEEKKPDTQRDNWMRPG